VAPFRGRSKAVLKSKFPGARLHQAGNHQSAITRVRAPRRPAATSAVLATGFAAALLLAGCGVQYRPVVSAINPVGPAGQPTKYAVAVSIPSATTPGLVTYVDFAGDTVLSTPNILTNPNYFAITQNGSEGYAINAAGSLDSFALSNPEAVITSTIGQTTLAADANPTSITAVEPAGSTETLFIPEPTSSRIAVLSGAGTAPALLQELAVGANPVYVVGADGAPRVYALSQGAGGGNGTIASIEAISSTSLAVSTTIPVGIAPVYGVMTTDDRRAFILNQGSGTVSVVNVINDALDTANPTITLPNINGTIAPRPIWADLSTVNDELVVLNQGDGVNPGSLSIINIPLCNASTQPSNSNCNPANPVDATGSGGFGTFVKTVNVGINPTMVSVLHDGSAAYVINQGNGAAGTPCNGQGSVSVVNLISGVVTSTICAEAANTGSTSDAFIHGHPNSVSATTGNPTGKVYVTASDSTDLSVIYTDTNTVQTHITLQGLGLRVLVNAP
jgi:hypothetical protein